MILSDMLKLIKRNKNVNMENYIDQMLYSSDKFDTRNKSFSDFIVKMAKDYENHFNVHFDDVRQLKFDKIIKDNPSALAGAFKHLIFNTSSYRQFCDIVSTYGLKAYGTHVQARLNVGNSLLILYKRSQKFYENQSTEE